MNLSQLNSDDIRKVLKIRKTIETLEEQLLDIARKAQKRKPSEAAALRGFPRRQQPSLRELVGTILRKAKKPMSVQDIYEATLVSGYHWRSQEPINALNVKMYTDDTFKKIAPGRFVLRRPNAPVSR
jgi:hypothetical protein